MKKLFTAFLLILVMITGFPQHATVPFPIDTKIPSSSVILQLFKGEKRNSGSEKLEVVIFSPYAFTRDFNLTCGEKLELGIKFPQSIEASVQNYINGSRNNIMNPFDPSHINIQADFFRYDSLSRLWKETGIRYGFYYDEFIRDTSHEDANNWFWKKDTTSYHFRIRFSTMNEGIYKFSVKAMIQETGEIFSDTYYFAVNGKSSFLPGFMKAGGSKKYFSRGENFFLPIGQNLPFQQCHDCKNYKDISEDGKSSEAWSGKNLKPKAYLVYQKDLEQLRKSGANYFRMIFAPWAIELEFESPGNYSARMSSAWELDRILDKALQLNLLMHLNLQAHYALENPSVYSLIYWDWPANTCNDVMPWIIDNGFGYREKFSLQKPVDFFTDEGAKNAWKNKLRYIISRWGYSQNIGAIELFSEINNAGNEYAYKKVSNETCAYAGGELISNPYSDPQVRKIIYQWQDEMAKYIKTSLHHTDHLISVSYAGDISGFSDDSTFHSPWIDVRSFNFYSLPVGEYKSGNIEFFTPGRIHRYVYNTGKFKNNYPVTRPLMHSETGLPDHDECSNYTEWIKTLWSTAFSGLAAAGMNWSGQYHYELWKHFGYLRDFINGTDFSNWTSHYENRGDKYAEAVYLVSPSKTEAMGVLVNTSYNHYTMGTGACRNKNLDPGKNYNVKRDVESGFWSRQKLRLTGLAKSTRYSIVWYDATTGNWLENFAVKSSSNGNLLLDHYNLVMEGDVISPVLGFRISLRKE